MENRHSYILLILNSVAYEKLGISQGRNSYIVSILDLTTSIFFLLYTHFRMSKMKNVLFKEKQRYNDKVVIAVLGMITLGAFVLAIKFLIQPEKNYATSILLLVLSFSFGLLIWWLTKLKLKVIINDKYIQFKLSPIHGTKRTISWEDIDQCDIVKTPPAAQWSGGNITYNHEKRISLTGRNGLALRTKKGENYFIGCKNIEELKKALEKIDFS